MQAGAEPVRRGRLRSPHGFAVRNKQMYVICNSQSKGTWKNFQALQGPVGTLLHKDQGTYHDE